MPHQVFPPVLRQLQKQLHMRFPGLPDAPYEYEESEENTCKGAAYFDLLQRAGDWRAFRCGALERQSESLKEQHSEVGVKA